jgi:hypothetical protein
METDVTPAEHAQRVINAHTKGIICSGEVWNQMVQHSTSNAFHEFLTRLTPELDRYLKRVVLGHPSIDTEQERVSVELLRKWYENTVA